MLNSMKTLAENVLPALKVEADMVLVDPPRAGVEKEALGCNHKNESENNGLCFVRSVHAGARCQTIDRWRL